MSMPGIKKAFDGIHVLKYWCMAAEAILIVDDTPVNLKLTRILLTNEGYEVTTAASAEEALELLKSSHPSLVLADIQLPGMDGLELTRQIKQNPATKDILVVALTAYAMKGDEQRAMDAGCDGYITKPIDTRTLGMRLREYLDRRRQAQAKVAAPPPEPGSSASSAFQETDMAALRQTFLAEGLERSRALLTEIDGQFNAVEAAKPVHQWAGTSGLLGYSAIGRMAREVETLLRERPIDQSLLREKMANLVAAFANPRESRDAPVPDYVLEALSGRRVALVELPAAEQERLAAALERANTISEIYEGGGTTIPQPLLTCDLAVVHVHPQSPIAAWLSPDSQLWNATAVVLTGRREDLVTMPQAALVHAREFLMDSWQPDEALVRLSLALTRPSVPVAQVRAAPARPVIVVADDDPTVVALVRTSLQNFGMEAHTASNGASALEMIRNLRPHAAVLDVNMPGMDGYAVLSAVHTELPSLRVLLLTARQQESDVTRGFALGADDYVIKPFSPMELVARLKRLLGR